MRKREQGSLSILRSVVLSGKKGSGGADSKLFFLYFLKSSKEEFHFEAKENWSHFGLGSPLEMEQNQILPAERKWQLY